MKFNVFISLVYVVFGSAEVINETKACADNSAKSADDFTSVFLLNRINEQLSSATSLIDNVLKKLENIDFRLIKLELHSQEKSENFKMENRLTTVRMENIEKNIDSLKMLLYSSKYSDHGCSPKQDEVIFKNIFTAFTKNDNNDTLGNTVEIPSVNSTSSLSTTPATIIQHQSDKDKYPYDCSDTLRLFGNKSGVYKIQPKYAASPISVYCDHSVRGGGWTVIQNRFNGSVDFYRAWQEYKQGFGEPHGEYWLGLENVHLLTNNKINELYFLLEDFNNDKAYAYYDSFLIGPESINYKVTVLGTYEGTAGNNFASIKDFAFSTFDKDHDTLDQNCAKIYHGAWWFKACFVCHLNGNYSKVPAVPYAQGLIWESYKGFHYSLKSTRIMIRPRIKQVVL